MPDALHPSAAGMRAIAAGLEPLSALVAEAWEEADLADRRRSRAPAASRRSTSATCPTRCTPRPTACAAIAAGLEPLVSALVAEACMGGGGGGRAGVVGSERGLTRRSFRACSRGRYRGRCLRQGSMVEACA